MQLMMLWYSESYLKGGQLCFNINVLQETVMISITIQSIQQINFTLVNLQRQHYDECNQYEYNTAVYKRDTHEGEINGLETNLC